MTPQGIHFSLGHLHIEQGAADNHIMPFLAGIEHHAAGVVHLIAWLPGVGLFVP